MATPDRFEDHCWKDLVAPEDLALYRPYARETYVGSRPALLAIDLYNLVYRGGARHPRELHETFPSSCGIFAHQAIEPTKRLFAAARAAGIPVFYSTSEVRKHMRPKDAKATLRAKPADRQPDDLDIYPAFAPQDGDVVIYKQRASAFQGTPLTSHLALLGINSLIMCGESTSGCVRASAVDAYSSGYHVSLVEECTFDRHELSHKVSLFDMHHKYLDLMTVDEVVAHLNGMTKKAAAE